LTPARFHSRWHRTPRRTPPMPTRPVGELCHRSTRPLRGRSTPTLLLLCLRPARSSLTGAIRCHEEARTRPPAPAEFRLVLRSTVGTRREGHDCRDCVFARRSRVARDRAMRRPPRDSLPPQSRSSRSTPSHPSLRPRESTWGEVEVVTIELSIRQTGALAGVERHRDELPDRLEGARVIVAAGLGLQRAQLRGSGRACRDDR
jgi:hypothetical protein